jgi:hypothetical protein
VIIVEDVEAFLKLGDLVDGEAWSDVLLQPGVDVGGGGLCGGLRL